MVDKNTMISRNSSVHNQKEIDQLRKEIEQLKKQNEKKQRDYEKQAAKNKAYEQKIIAAREAKILRKKKADRKKLYKQIVKAKRIQDSVLKRRQVEALKELRKQREATKKEVARIKKEEALVKQELAKKEKIKQAEIAKQEKARQAELAKQKEEAERLKRLEESNKKKEEAKKAKQLKVIAAKESRYKKSLQRKNFLKSGIKNLKTYSVGILAGACIVLGIYGICKSGALDALKTKEDTQTYIDNAKEETSTEASTVEQPQDNSNYESTEEVTQPIDEEEVIIEKHEYIDTDLYDSGYEFNNEITGEFLNSLNPAPSDDTVWINIPGTSIDYPVVHPSVNNIDKVEGLRDWVEAGKAEYLKEGIEANDYAVMDDYYIKKNIAGDKYAAGTLYLSAYNNKLSQSFDNLSDMNIIYGHNMKKDSVYPKMFHDLRYYMQNKDYIKENPMAIIYTSDGYGYAVQLIAARSVSSESNSVLHIQNFESQDEKERFVYDFITDAKNQGYTTVDGFELTSDTKLMQFVTCDGNNKEVVLGIINGKIKVNDGIVDESGYYVEETSTLHR